jgi:hypothetical protein
MLGIVEIESISSLFLSAGRQGGRGQSPILSNGVYFNIKEVMLEEKFFKNPLTKPPRGILLSLLGALKFQSFFLRGIVTRLTFFPGIQDSKNGGGS